MHIKKNDSSKKRIIFPENPHEPISSKFGTASHLVDLITHENFCGDRHRVFHSARGRILAFSYLQAVDVNTMLGLPRSL